MYRFQVSCTTQWGESLAVVGSAPCLGSWDVQKAVPLSAEYYPCWKSQEVDVSQAGDRLEYKYIKKTPHGVEWEPGGNRWVPVEADAYGVTVHDGCFGEVQPEPFSFHEYDDRPKLQDAVEGQKRVVVIGSSVAEGYNAWRKRGWAWRLGEALGLMYGHDLVNVSQSGANTQVTQERFMQAVCPWKPDVVIIALSLGNEGLAHCPPGQRHAAQHRFEQGLLELLKMVVSINAIPMLGGVYPNNDFVPETYAMLKETRRTLSAWGVPVFDWLAALDDGHGRWKSGLFFDHAHPNTVGHRRMFESIDLSLFDFDDGPAAINAIPAMIRRRSSLAEFDSMERKTSYSSLDSKVIASQEEVKRAMQNEGVVFSDGHGFSIAMSQGVLSIRNKTPHEYSISGEWHDLCDALVRAGLCPGVYVSRDTSAGSGGGGGGSDGDATVLRAGEGGGIVSCLAVPPGADAVFLPAFQQVGHDR